MSRIKQFLFSYVRSCCITLQSGWYWPFPLSYRSALPQPPAPPALTGVPFQLFWTMCSSSHFGFNLQFLYEWWRWTSFKEIICHLYFWQNLLCIFAFFQLLKIWSFLYSIKQVFFDINLTNDFSILWLSFYPLTKCYIEQRLLILMQYNLIIPFIDYSSTIFNNFVQTLDTEYLFPKYFIISTFIFRSLN